ncbi:MAG: extracellular solute-binding protein [Spirochaetaceae bacterium]
MIIFLKKEVSILMVLLSALLLFSGCTASTKKSKSVAKDEVVVVEKEMTHDELVAAAQAEGKVVVYSVSSRISKAAVTFEAKYGIKVEATNLKDFELIEKVSKEGSTGVKGADFVLAQDGGRVMGELINLDYLYNYVPPTMKDIIPAKYQEPLVFSIINKVFIYNNEKTNEYPLTNIWELTEPKWKGQFQFKNPFQEGVNANFMTMVTSDKVAKKIADAYKSLYGKDIVLTTKNAGYEWIKSVFDNGLVLTSSDTTTAENIGIRGQAKQHVGLFVYSKFRYAKTKNLALAPIMEMEPFSGFYYPIYALMSRGAENEYAAKLFIEHLLTEEGFKPWSVNIGTYSSNPTIGIQEGDHPVSVWDKILVEEDPEYCFENRAEVEAFLNNYIY